MRALWLALLIFATGLPGAAYAAGPLDAWRGEVAATRMLAENDPPRAHEEAQRLQRSLPADATPADRARVLNLLSRIELYLALTEAAAKHAQLALDMASQNGDSVGQAEAQLNVVLNSINQARIDLSIAATTRSMELLDGANRPDLLGEALLRMSMMYRRMGDWDSSITMAMQSMEIAKRNHDPLALTYAHQGLAISLEQSGSFAQAREHYAQMRDQARAAHSKILEGDAIRGLGGVMANLGDTAGGEALTREAVAMFRSLQIPFYLNHVLFGLAEMLHKQGRHAEAAAVLDEIIATYERYSNKIGLWWSLGARSTSYQSQGNVSAARTDAERAYTLAGGIDFSYYRSESAKRMAEVIAATGDHRRAYQFSVEASSMADKAARERTSTRMVELAQRYETESKQREIDELTRRNEQQTAELRQRELQQRWLWIVLGGSAVTLSGTVYFLLRLRRSKRMLEALNAQVQRSQNKLQATLDAMPDLMFELGLDGRYLEVHHPRSDLLIAPAESLVGKTVSDVMSAESANICLSALREAHEKGYSTGHQLELTLPHGKFWFELSIARKKVAAGDKPRFIGISRDITERKRAEELLHAREQEFRAMVEHSPDNIVRYDAECRRTYVNPVMLAQFGLPAEKVLGSTPLEITAITDAQAYVERIQAVLKTGQESRMEFRYHDVHGVARWGDMRMMPEFGLDGAVTSVLAVNRDITERMRMEEALREREQRYRGIFDNVLDTLYLLEVTPEGRFRNLEVNPAFEKSSGMSSAELIGKFIDETVPQEVAEIVTAKYRRCIEAGTAIDEEATLDMPSGLRHYHSTLVPVRDASGRIHRIVGISRDITERKRLEEELTVREREFRTLAENSPDPIYRYDRDCRRLYVNAVVGRILGKPVDALIGTSPADGAILVSEQNKKLMQAIRQVFDSGESAQCDLDFLAKDGQHRDYQMLLVPERDAAGRVATVLAMARDFTTIRNAERRMSHFLESMPGFVYTLRGSPDGHFSLPFASAGIKDIYGVRPEDVVDDATTITAHVLHPDDVDRVTAGILESARTLAPYQIEFRVALPGRGERWIESRALPEREAEGSTLWHGIMLDITERKRMERHLERAQHLLRQLAHRNETAREDERKHLKRELHDELGQYLLALRLGVSIVDLQYGGGNPPLREKTIRLIEMVDSTIKVVRNVVASLRPAALELGIVSAMEWLVGEYSTQAGIQCELHVAGTDIPLDEDRATAIFRIAQESLTNIVRHAKASRVKMTLERTGDDLILEVRDNGVGFDAALRKDQSFGLLSIRERALMLGGEVDISSTSGHGTSIRVHIPIHNAVSNALSGS